MMVLQKAKGQRENRTYIIFLSEQREGTTRRDNAKGQRVYQISIRATRWQRKEWGSPTWPAILLMLLLPPNRMRQYY